MIRIKLCGLTRPADIEAANELKPEYIGFVFWKNSRRCVTPEQAAELKRRLHPDISAVGVFVDEEPEAVTALLGRGIIDLAQLHGSEDEDYIRRLRGLTDRKIIKAFRMDGEKDLEAARNSGADYVLLDSGKGTGTPFDWELIKGIERPFFLAGGLNPENVGEAVRRFRPFAVDVSSGIELDGQKSGEKMRSFVAAVKKAECEDEKNDKS